MLNKSSWWLVACSVFEAAFAAAAFVQTREISTLRSFTHTREALLQMGLLALGAGLCAIAGSLNRYRNTSSWLLTANGAGCSVLGFIFAFWTGRLAFRTVALLLAVMGITLGLHELWGAIRERMLRIAVAALSLTFGLAFLGLAIHWIELDPRSPAASLYWLGAYFSFAAVNTALLAWENGASSFGPRRELKFS
jgi:hypothetical protein